MDFRQSSQPGPARPVAASPVPAPEHKESKQPIVAGTKKSRTQKFMAIANGILLISVAVLVAGVAVAINHGSSSNESKYIQANKYQAVFLNNGQVYFGNVDSLNSKYLRMTNVYYLTQSGETTNSNYSLVKLGCQQIHDPVDEMLINRDQVTFWENLQDDGKVVTSIKDFQKQNPKGPDCSQVSNQTQASGTSTQGTSTTPTTGTTNNSTNPTK